MKFAIGNPYDFRTKRIRIKHNFQTVRFMARGIVFHRSSKGRFRSFFGYFWQFVKSIFEPSNLRYIEFHKAIKEIARCHENHTISDDIYAYCTNDALKAFEDHSVFHF